MCATLIDSNMRNIILAAAHNRAQILERSSAEELYVYYFTMTLIGIPYTLEKRKGQIFDKRVEKTNGTNGYLRNVNSLH